MNNNLKVTIVTLNGRKPHLANPRTTRESIIFSVFWAFLVFLNTFFSGQFNKIPYLNIDTNSTPLAIKKAWGQGDAGSLLDVAITFANFQNLDPTTQYWIPRFWPLGLSLIEVPLIWLDSAGIAIFWTLLFLTIAIWAGIFFLVWKYFSPYFGRIPTLLTLISLIYTWDFEYMLKDYIFYTEGIGFGLLTLGLILLTIQTIEYEHVSRKVLFVSGVLVGTSLWIRHTNESGLILIFVASTTIFLIKEIKDRIAIREFSKSHNNRKIYRLKTKLQSSSKSRAYKDLVIFSTVGLLITLPWRFVSKFLFNAQSFAMSDASGTVPLSIWAEPDSASGKYWGKLGSNWACKIDEVTCSELQKKISEGSSSKLELILEAIFSALRNPFEYLKERSHYLFQNWIPSEPPRESYQNFAANLYFLVALLCVVLYLRITDERKKPLMLLWVGFLVMNTGQLLFIHYESRYFIPLRLLVLGIISFLLILTMKARSSKKKFNTSE